MKLINTLGSAALLVFGGIGCAEGAEKPAAAKVQAEKPVEAKTQARKGTITDGDREIKYTVRKGSTYSVETTESIGEMFINMAWWRYPECNKTGEYAPNRGMVMVIAQNYPYPSPDYSIITLEDYDCDSRVDSVSLEGTKTVVDFFTKNGYAEKGNATNLLKSFTEQRIKKAVPLLESEIELWLNKTK